MLLRHGKIERAIFAAIKANRKPRAGKPGSVLISSANLALKVYNSASTVSGSTAWANPERRIRWRPTRGQSHAVSLAMNRFVRKHGQYALAGGQGARRLFLYDARDPISAAWARLTAEHKGRRIICRRDAEQAVRELRPAIEAMEPR